MEFPTRKELHDLNVASRKAEEAAGRRFQATQWLECLLGPLGISTQPSEREFISCLRNGLVLCNAVNKVQPGSVSKIVESHLPSQSLTRDSQPLPAYQHFENVRNFLVAVEELKLPAFEASDLEKENLEAGSSTKIVDCILALKAYHEWKLMGGGNGNLKPPRSPLVLNSANRILSRGLGPVPSDPCRRLEMSAVSDKQLSTESETQKLEASIVRALAECMVDTKENIDDNRIASFRSRELLESVFKDILREGSHSLACSTSTPLENLPTSGIRMCCRTCLEKNNCNHWYLFQMQEKELCNIKELLLVIKNEFMDLRSLLQIDLEQLGKQVQDMSTNALGFQKVVKENRSLYNMVQDLRGNIHVCCRIRPAFNVGPKTVIDFTGEDGSLVVVDPLSTQKDGKKVFQFNRVFGPTASQDEVFRETEPLIRSVMDGYNVCILAYGQTGSGKTHTMCGPPGGSAMEQGINYLALNYLFRLSSGRKDVIKYEILVQMVEIYNEQVRDLLAEDSSATKLEIRSCTGVPDATMHTVQSTADVLNLMKLGELNRVVSSTAINKRSSRSHSILTIHVHGEDVSGSILRSCLHLVDLAGSERVDKSEVTGEGLKEAQYINKSLSCLGDVITALAQKNSYIPYRNSKLTLLLQNSLGGRAKTLMIAHVSPEGDSFGETISTLKFAQRVSIVELGAARANKESNEVLDLKEQIENLKKALAAKESRLQLNKAKELRLPFEKPKIVAERTPPRLERLGTENCSTTVKMETVTNSECRKGPKNPSLPSRSRRLSLEGPRFVNNDVQFKISKAVNKPLQFESISLHKHDKLQDTDNISMQDECKNDGGSMVDLYHRGAPRSPTYSAYQNRVVKIDNRTKIESLQQPKTPEPPALDKNQVQSVMKIVDTSANSLTSSSIGSTNGKGSQIRKSLWTIGKLINGSEKRNQQKLIEIQSPLNVTSSIQSERSRITAKARAQRRQSLTGIQTADRSRRSSLGGNSTLSYTNETRNAKTPPPVHASSRMTKQWL